MRGGGGGGGDALNAYLLLVGSGAEAGTEAGRVRLRGSPDALEESGQPLVILEWVVPRVLASGPCTGRGMERVRIGRLPVRRPMRVDQL